MAANQQLAFLEDFETSRPPNPLFCQQEFLEKLVDHGRDAIGRRAAFLTQRLLVDIRRLHYKATAGSTREWIEMETQDTGPEDFIEQVVRVFEAVSVDPLVMEFMPSLLSR